MQPVAFDPTEGVFDGILRTSKSRGLVEETKNPVGNSVLHYFGKMGRHIFKPSTHMKKVWQTMHDVGMQRINGAGQNFLTPQEKLVRLELLRTNLERFERNVIGRHNERRFGLFKFFHLAGIRIDPNAAYADINLQMALIREQGVEIRAAELDAQEAELQQQANQLNNRAQQLNQRDVQQDTREGFLNQREADLDLREGNLNGQEEELNQREQFIQKMEMQKPFELACLQQFTQENKDDFVAGVKGKIDLKGSEDFKKFPQSLQSGLSMIKTEGQDSAKLVDAHVSALEHYIRDEPDSDFKTALELILLAHRYEIESMRDLECPVSSAIVNTETEFVRVRGAAGKYIYFDKAMLVVVLKTQTAHQAASLGFAWNPGENGQPGSIVAVQEEIPDGLINFIDRWNEFQSGIKIKEMKD